MLTEHDQYAGFDLAPGTVVIPNIWHVPHTHRTNS